MEGFLGNEKWTNNAAHDTRLLGTLILDPNKYMIACKSLDWCFRCFLKVMTRQIKGSINTMAWKIHKQNQQLDDRWV